MLEARLAKIRADDPKKFALFTGRDQMQALTGLFARQFGTPNYAAHGGFCSVNMAAGMIYTIGGSFWEFGGPGPRPRQAVRDDRHRRGPSFESAQDRDLEVQARGRALHLDQPGAHRLFGDRRRMGADHARAPTARFLLAVIHELIATGLYDRDFLVRYTNAGQLVNADAGSARFGLLAQDAASPEVNAMYPQNKLWWDRATDRAGRDPHARRGPVPVRRLRAARRHAGEAGVSRCSTSGCANTRPSGRRASRAFRPTRFAASPTRWASPRATRRSSCRSRGPIRGAWTTTRSPAIPSRFTRCAGSPRTRTAFRRSARSRSSCRCSAPSTGPAGSATRRRSRARFRRPPSRPIIPDAVRPEYAARRASRSDGRRRPTISSSTTTATRCASTRASRGSTRCRCTGSCTT